MKFIMHHKYKYFFYMPGRKISEIRVLFYIYLEERYRLTEEVKIIDRKGPSSIMRCSSAAAQ
jgi:hypothetical protein